MPLFKQHVIGRFQFIYRPIDSPGIRGLNRNQSGATAMLVIEQGVVEIKQNYAHDSRCSATPKVPSARATPVGYQRALLSDTYVNLTVAPQVPAHGRSLCRPGRWPPHNSENRGPLILGNTP